MPRPRGGVPGRARLRAGPRRRPLSLQLGPWHLAPPRLVLGVCVGCVPPGLGGQRARRAPQRPLSTRPGRQQGSLLPHGAHTRAHVVHTRLRRGHPTSRPTDRTGRALVLAPQTARLLRQSRPPHQPGEGPVPVGRAGGGVGTAGRTASGPAVALHLSARSDWAERSTVALPGNRAPNSRAAGLRAQARTASPFLLPTRPSLQPSPGASRPQGLTWKLDQLATQSLQAAPGPGTRLRAGCSLL